MGISRSIRLLAVTLALAALGSSGCRLASLVYFLVPVESMAPPAKQLLTSRRDKRKIAVVSYADSNLRFTYDSLDTDLAALLTAEIATAEKRFEMTPERKVRAWRDKNPNWMETSLQKIGEEFDVDFVILLEISRFSINETKNQFLLQGATTVHFKIHDVRKDMVVFDEVYQREYPPNRSVPVADMPEEQFKRRFLRTIARELSWYIVPHRFADEVNDV